MKKIAALFMALTLISNLSAGETFPPPANTDVSKFGWGIQRSMTLMATSTPEKKNTVRVLFYGQSITEQKWWKQVAADLKARFPNANLIIENRAIGGFASQILSRIAEHDAYPFYPDLVIFYVYGDHNRYDEIIHNFRSRTTAEVLMQTEHMALGDQKWPETMSTKLLPEIAKKYGAELADIRTQWQQYLTDNKLEAKALLTDAVHLNDHGCFVEASLISRYLRHDAKFPTEPCKDLVKDVEPKWDGGKLKLEFEGNRVDVIAAANATAGAKAKVLIDGKAPSEFPGCYYYTRPNADRGFIWTGGAVIRVDSEKPRIEEEWTLTFTEINDKRDAFKYKVSGSKTGADGEGGSAGKFVSNSGRVVIDPKDFHWGFEKKPVNPGFEIKWKCKPLSVDTYSIPATPATGIENATTLAQGFPNEKHTLELISEDGKPLPIQTLRVYKPGVK